MVVRSTGRALAYGAGIAAGAYATYAATTWLRDGHARPAAGRDADPLLDRFMPAYEVDAERRARERRRTADRVAPVSAEDLDPEC